MKKFLLLFFVLLLIQPVVAQDGDEYEVEEDSSYQAMIDSIEASFKYQIGSIDINDGLATLTVPDGYRFMGPEQSAYVLSDLWGNPPRDVIGLLFPKGVSPLGDGFTYVVSITYSEEGFIDDEDAKDLDYDELLEGMQEDVALANDDRIAQGYGTAELIGWASPPFYDEANKKLHWAKEIKFDNAEVNTLNYNIRILGRRGYLNLNAIGEMDILSLFKNDVDKILASVEFKEGNTYSDFDPDVDEIAAYGIGGLIAGKVLLKLGFFAKFLGFFKVIGVFLLKAWKPIAIGFVAVGAGLRKYFLKSDKDKQSKKLFNPEEELARKQEEAEPEDKPEEEGNSDEDGEVSDADFDEDAKGKV